MSNNQLRVSEKCFQETTYSKIDEDGYKIGRRGSYPMCVYYDPKTGCTLNGCIKNFRK